MGLIRILLFSALAYGLMLVAFPHWEGHQAYHAVSLSVVAGAAVGLWLALEAVDIGAGMLKLAIELAFAAGVMFYLGCTMPQKSGLTPMEQWAQGHRPNQAEAREGLAHIGLDANGKPGSLIVSLFPR